MFTCRNVHFSWVDQMLRATSSHEMNCHFVQASKIIRANSNLHCLFYLHYLACEGPIEEHVIDVSSGQIWQYF